jgi:ankyrin repeat protein
MQMQLNKAFALAVRHDNLEMVKCMLETSPELSKKALAVTDGYTTPLHSAVENNNLKMVKFLLQTAPEEFKQASLIKNGHTNEDDTPLSLAFNKNNLEMMQLLIMYVCYNTK